MDKFSATVPAAAASLLIFAAIISVSSTASAQVSPVASISPPPYGLPAILDTNNTISVTGMATEKVAPDRVVVTFAVETVSESAGDALAENSETMNSVLAALEDAGVQENETSTAFFSIFPNYNFSEFGDTRELTGYTVTNSIMVESSDLEGISEWIDAAVEAGANRVDGIFFTVSQETMDEMRSGLVEDAVANARDKADALASALEIDITGVKAASLVDFNFPISPALSFREGAVSDVSTPIIPGEQSVTATVAVIYEIG